MRSLPAFWDGRVRFESGQAAGKLAIGCREHGDCSVPGSEQPTGCTGRRRTNMASTELQAIVRFRFHDGDVEEFKRLSAQCMEIVRAQDTGTLQYDTYFNDDETECIVIERFRDSDALIQHGEHLAHLMDAIVATGSVSGELLGEPSTELRARFTGGGPVQLFTPWVTM
jgi:quinol monooxygenase YgiN